jgi:hypothetical protein
MAVFSGPRNPAISNVAVLIDMATLTLHAVFPGMKLKPKYNKCQPRESELWQTIKLL